MRSRRIGSLDVSVVGLGCNNFGRRLDEGRTRGVVDAALDQGVTFLDTADIYGDTMSERFLGRVLEGRRDRVVLASKFGMRAERGSSGGVPLSGGAAPDYVRHAIEGSLSRLRTDRIDLYQLHQPDDDVPIADTLAILDELVREGKVREIGCSNFSAAQLREAEAAVAEGAARFVSVQNELSLLRRDDLDDAVPESARLGVAYIPFFPLGSGLLTGKHQRGEPPAPGSRLAGWPDYVEEFFTDETFDRLDAFTAFAAERGRSLLDLAFAWLLATEPVVSVIAGATSPEQVAANVAAGGWVLTEDERAAVDAL